MLDPVTKSWIRNEADAKAAAEGYRFDLERAAWPIWWIGRYCRLYEGSHAGEPLVLRAAHSMSLDAIQDPWGAGGRKKSIQRVRDYMECFAAGEPVGWQFECIARLFGWVGFSQRWKAEVRRFNKGAIFVAKKNGKSPTLAAIALYLMCADGEQGNKVFLAATNKEQAQEIAGAHAVEMIVSSPELQRECKIDKGESKISHEPTRSMMKPLSSGDTRSQRAKEGLNGSALVDEVHVVCREFMARMVRMGASRREPFILSFSTAGNDVDSYGYDEWSYGTKNNATGENGHYFFQSYEAPQGISDADLDANLETYARAANPAIGHLVDMEEIRQDYLSSRVTQAKLSEFKQYRLNIWSRTATPWIAMDDWKAHRRPRKLPVKNQVCWGAIDLGYVDEPSAFTLVFPDDHTIIDDAVASGKHLVELLGALDQPVYARTWYWLPRGAIERWRHVLPYADWAEKKLVKVQRGLTVNLNGIVKDVCAIMGRYDVQALAFDPARAAVVAASICQSDGYPEERCFEFPQNSPKQWAFPCAVMERLVINGKLKHKNNAVLDWEMGHATVKEDRLGGVSIVKPQRGDRKKVNGLASLIMALDAMARAERHYRSQLICLG